LSFGLPLPVVISLVPPALIYHQRLINQAYQRPHGLIPSTPEAYIKA
jgi:hypothetical protein